MRKTIKLTALIAILGLLQACGGNPEDLEAKKAKLSELRTQASELKAQIRQLEDEITTLDPEFGKNANNIILITTTELKPSTFEHKIEVRGTVESRKNVMVSAETAGRIESIKVKEGQSVKKGQVMLVLDASIVRNNIEELKTALDLAKIVFERQSNLWNKKIGTEIQYLEAKNRKEAIERQLATAQSMLDQSIVTAPFSGSIDEVPVKVGEMASPGLPLLRIVNPNEMYIKADISENYIGKFRKGETADIHFPSLDQYTTSTISSVSRVINRENRTFEVEIDLPNVDFEVRPNQVCVLNMRDYLNETALVVPTKLIQRDDKGTFLYGTAKNEEENLIARKLHVTTGLSYDSHTEIIAGLDGNEEVIDRGFRDLTEGVEVKLATSETASN